MKSTRDPDAIIAGWLEDGPTELPDPVRRSIVTAARATPQKRRSGAPWMSFGMNSAFKLAAGAVAVLAIALVGAYLLGRTPVGDQPPIPTATPAGERGSVVEFAQPFEYILPAGSGLQLATDSAEVTAFEVGGAAGNVEGVVVRSANSGLVNPCAPSDGAVELNPGADAVIAYLRSIPGFEVSDATPTTVDGLPAFSVDVVVRPESGCEGMTLWPDSIPFTELLPPDEIPTLRFIATEVSASNVVVMIWAHDLDTWLPTANSFVESLHFR